MTSQVEDFKAQSRYEISMASGRICVAGGHLLCFVIASLGLQLIIVNIYE
jgi:hypothetical protein